MINSPPYSGPDRRKRPRWRPRPLRVLLILLLLSAMGYAAAVMWLIGQETRLVFQAGSTLATGRPPFPYEQVDVPRDDGASQFAWAMPAADPAAPVWVLYLHGNATSVASQVNIAHYRLLRNAGLNVLAPEYRGFGGLAGSPTEAALQADARAAYDYLRHTRRVPPHAIVLYGWSLGARGGGRPGLAPAARGDHSRRRAGLAHRPDRPPLSVLPAAAVHAQLLRLDPQDRPDSRARCCSCTARTTRSSRSARAAGCYEAAQGRQDVRRGRRAAT